MPVLGQYEVRRWAGMARTSDDVRFGVPLYTQTEAAHYLDMPPSTFRKWARGYRNRFPDRPDVVGDPMITSLRAPTSTHPSIPFIGLAEGMFLSALRRADLPMQRIRPALELVRKRLGVDYALASRKLFVSGAELLYEVTDDLGERDRKDATNKLIVLRDGQYVFREVVERHMKQIEYDEQDGGYATKLALPGYEVADLSVRPGVNFGRPYFTKTGTPLHVVQGQLRAGERAEDVADDFDIPSDEVAEVSDRMGLKAS